MKSSNFNIFVEYPKTGEMLLYNTLFGSLTLWDAEEVAHVRMLLANPNQANDHTAIRQILVEQKHLIASDVDEIAVIKNRKIAGIVDENRLDLIIMPTLDCNFTCAYCYETHRSGKMTREVQTAIKRWIQQEVPQYKVVMLHWFGGEPLICWEQLTDITQHLRSVARATNALCLLHVTTNGYLLGKKLAKTLTDEGIRDFQITIDGIPQTHDQLRVLRNGRGTFKRIFENIVNLVKIDPNVKITLRVNFNRSNLHTIPELLELFPENIRAHLRIVYEPIFGQCALSATENIPSQEISQAMIDYYQLADSLGYDVVIGRASLYPGKLVYCYAERKNQYIINCNGDVFKCSVSQFNPDERVGYIRHDGIFIKDQSQWDRWFGEDLFEEKCFTCVYLPLCMGGCRKARLQHQGTGSYCALVATNTSYMLKQIALGQFSNILRDENTFRENP